MKIIYKVLIFSNKKFHFFLLNSEKWSAKMIIFSEFTPILNKKGRSFDRPNT